MIGSQYAASPPGPPLQAFDFVKSTAFLLFRLAVGGRMITKTLMEFELSR